MPFLTDWRQETQKCKLEPTFLNVYLPSPLVFIVLCIAHCKSWFWGGPGRYSRRVKEQRATLRAESYLTGFQFACYRNNMQPSSTGLILFRTVFRTIHTCTRVYVYSLPCHLLIGDIIHALLRYGMALPYRVCSPPHSVSVSIKCSFPLTHIASKLMAFRTCVWTCGCKLYF